MHGANISTTAKALQIQIGDHDNVALHLQGIMM